MKIQLYIYALLILTFIAYNLWFKVSDQRTDTAINIIFSSVLFLYMSYLAYVVLKKAKNK